METEKYGRKRKDINTDETKETRYIKLFHPQ